MTMKISERAARQALETQRMRYVLTISTCGAICALLGVAYVVI